VTDVSVNIITAQRGSLLEGILWAAFTMWFVSFVCAWLLRWWEILTRREVKRAALNAQAERKKKAEAAKNKPMKPEEAVLRQMAVSGM